MPRVPRSRRRVVTRLPRRRSPSAQHLVLSDARDPDFRDGRVIATLPARQQTVVVLRYYGDWTTAEIADALGTRPGTVKSLLHRALARLRDQLSDTPTTTGTHKPIIQITNGTKP